jgi:hypothetical protein
MKPTTAKKNPHWRVRWMVFTIIVAAIWFRYPIMPRASSDQLGTYLVTLLISATLIYAVFGRIVVWFVVGLMSLGHAFGRSFREAEQNRRTMREIAERLNAAKPEKPQFLEPKSRLRVVAAPKQPEHVAPEAVPVFGSDRVLN